MNIDLYQDVFDATTYKQDTGYDVANFSLTAAIMRVCYYNRWTSGRSNQVNAGLLLRTTTTTRATNMIGYDSLSPFVMET